MEIAETARQQDEAEKAAVIKTETAAYKAAHKLVRHLIHS